MHLGVEVIDAHVQAIHAGSFSLSQQCFCPQSSVGPDGDESRSGIEPADNLEKILAKQGLATGKRDAEESKLVHLPGQYRELIDRKQASSALALRIPK